MQFSDVVGLHTGRRDVDFEIEGLVNVFVDSVYRGVALEGMWTAIHTSGGIGLESHNPFATVLPAPSRYGHR